MKNLRVLLKSENGIVLAISLLILTLLVAGGIGAIFSTQMELNSSGNLRKEKNAFYLAEAGLHQAWQSFDHVGARNTFEEIFNGSGVTDILRNVAFASGSYTVTAERIPGSYPKRLKVTSSGCFPAGEPCPSGSSKAVIEAQYARDPLFPCLLCGKESISLSPGTRTDSYDSRKGPYNVSTAGSHGHIQSNGDIALTGATTLVNGDAKAVGTVFASDGAVVTGSKIGGATPFGFPRVIPCGPPFSSGAGIVGGSYDPSTGQLRGAGSDAIIIGSGTYCLSTVELSDNSTLTVAGPVTLNLTAHSTFAGGGILNPTANVESLRIISSLSSSSLGITVLSGSQAYATIYAPDGRVEVRGGGDFYGAVAGRTVVSTEGAKFHFDTKLKENENGKVKMVLWKEQL